MRNLPGPKPRRLLQSIAGDGPAAGEWLTPFRKRAILAGIVLCVLAVIAAVFSYRW